MNPEGMDERWLLDAEDTWPLEVPLEGDFDWTDPESPSRRARDIPIEDYPRNDGIPLRDHPRVRELLISTDLPTLDLSDCIPEDVASSYICAICLCVARKPMVHTARNSCLQIYCAPCIAEWILTRPVHNNIEECVNRCPARARVRDYMPLKTALLEFYQKI